MVKKRNNIAIPTALTPEEVAVRLEVNAIKARLLDKEVYSYFCNNILLKKNKAELIQQYFECSPQAADYLLTLSLIDLQVTTEYLEKERQLLLEGKGIA